MLKHDLLWFVGLAAILGGGLIFVKWYTKRAKTAPAADAA